jgi:hypothetical protein
MRFLVDVLSGLLKLSLILQKTYFENQIILLHLLLRNWQRIRNSLHKGVSEYQRHWFRSGGFRDWSDFEIVSKKGLKDLFEVASLKFEIEKFQIIETAYALDE